MLTRTATLLGAGLGVISAAIILLLRSLRATARRVWELELRLRRLQADQRWIRGGQDLLARCLINRLVWRRRTGG